MGQHEQRHCDAHLLLPAENDFLRKMNREHVGIVPAMTAGLLSTADSSPGPSSRYTFIFKLFNAETRLVRVRTCNVDLHIGGM